MFIPGFCGKTLNNVEKTQDDYPQTFPVTEEKLEKLTSPLHPLKEDLYCLLHYPKN